MQRTMRHTTGAYPYLVIEDEQFAGQCRIDSYAASGPGGQKRNRTYSAVRAVHLPTGLASIAEESRSQHENKRRALQRLRKNLALSLRAQSPDDAASAHTDAAALLPPEGPGRMNLKNPAYPLVCAIILDRLFFAKGKISTAAASLNISTGRLNRFLQRDRELHAAANALRKQFALKPLKTS